MKSSQIRIFSVILAIVCTYPYITFALSSTTVTIVQEPAKTIRQVDNSSKTPMLVNRGINTNNQNQLNVTKETFTDADKGNLTHDVNYDLTTLSSDVVDYFDTYIEENRCQSSSDKECLEILQFKACRSGCWRKGYNYRYDSAQRGRLDIHMSLDYLRKLRNLVSAELHNNEATSGQHTFGMTLKDLLYSQVQMMLRHPSMAFHRPFKSSSWPKIALRKIISGRTVDTTKFSGVVWTNSAGTSHAMTQADMMRWLVSVAEMFASRGYGSTGEYYLQLAERFFASFAIPHRFGGVRNNKTQFRCHGNKYCYWFHSQEVHDYPMASSVLNKDVYAIRDLTVTAHLLKRWQQFGACNCSGATCSRKFNKQSMVNGASYICNNPGDDYPIDAVASNLADQMLERARGGLFNLAYGPGNMSEGRSYRIPPPNLEDFKKQINGPSYSRNYFLSYYYYWIDDSPEPYTFERGPADITEKNNCHYHYLTLRLFSEVLQLTENSIYLSLNSDFTDVRYSLLYGRNPEHYNRNKSCSIKQRGTSNNMANVPLAEFYLSGRTPGLSFQVDHPRCSGPSSGFIWGLYQYRTWYDKRYENCNF